MTPAEFKAIRIAAGMTQVQLAEYLRVPVQRNRKRAISRTVQDWETPGRRIPGPAAELMRRLKHNPREAQAQHHNLA
jgi:DNA-binding transcriptional regulator YiaG